VYQVSYNITGLSGVRPAGEMAPIGDLSEVILLLGKMSSLRDNVTILDLPSGIKSGIWKGGGGYVFEVIGADGVFSKGCTKDELIEVLRELQQVVLRPESYGFVGESL